VDAFAATLQEARDADLLLHVVDASNPAHPEQIQNVMTVLHEIGAADIPQVLVFNKLDAIEPERRPIQRTDHMELEGLSVPRIFLSAHTGEGLDALRQLLSEHLMAQGAGPEALPEEASSGLGTIPPSP
jgi:GTP-binding protein HflX